METAQRVFENGVYSLVVIRSGAVLHRVFGRGIRPALELLRQPGLLQDAEVYDTIVGKAAASLFILGGAAAVFGQTMSRPAYDLLTAHGVRAEYDVLAEQIINRQGTGLCPFEQAVLEAETPEACLPIIEKTLQSLQTPN